MNSGTFNNSAGNVTVENDGTFFIKNAAVLDGGDVFLETGAVVQVTGVTSSGYYYSDPATLIIGDPSTFTGTIGGLGVGDVLEVTGKTITSDHIVGTTLSLDLAGGGTQTFNASPGQTGVSFFETPTGGLEVACFAEGTRILTDRGAMPVQALRAGDAVASAFGAIRRARWIGHRRIDCTCHPRPHEVWPVRIRAHAFAPGAPLNDLLLSPDHAVLVNDVLVPVRYLVNGASVVQEAVAEITYFHVELPSHNVLIAERLRCESYLDTGNRAAFAEPPAPASASFRLAMSA